MNQDNLQTRAQRLGVLCVDTLDEREIKEAMLRVLLPKHRPDRADDLIPQLPATPSAVIDDMLETLESEERIDDPQYKCLRPEDKIIRYSLTVSIMDSRNTSASNAAKVSMPELRASAVVFRQAKKLMLDLDKQRQSRHEEILNALISRHAHDKGAMHIWERFRQVDWALREALNNLDILGISAAQQQVDRIFAIRHPFAFGLVLLYAPIDVVWRKFGAFFQRMEDAHHRADVFRAVGRKPLSARQTADESLQLLRLFGLFPSARKRRRN